MIAANYDKNSDVLYLAVDRPCRAYSDEQKNGLLFRFSYDTNEPCGVTVFDYKIYWLSNKQNLVQEVASFLKRNSNEIIDVLPQPDDL